MKLSNVAELRSKAEQLRQASSMLSEKADFLDRHASEVEEGLTGIDDLLNGLNLDAVPKKQKARATSAASNGEKRGPGRPAGSKNRPKDDDSVAAPAPSAQASAGRRNKTSLRELISTVLKRNSGGLTLQEIVKKCLSEGYKSKTKGKFHQIVYQNLYKLMKDEHTVSKDADTKKYKRKAA